MMVSVPLSEANAPATRLHILIRGAVQGVGFRPFVYRRATELGLTGWVGNSTEGVVLEAEGGSDSIADLVEALQKEPPANATVDTIEMREIAPCGDAGFAIRPSEAAGTRTAEVSPDLATCPDCLAELFDTSDRRYLYPFINCTQCGPRYSLIEDVPYDRERTSMRRFPMCRTCRAEYQNPLNRRFHAEPIACPECGPRIALWDSAGRTLARDQDALLAAAAALRDGNIVAVKARGEAFRRDVPGAVGRDSGLPDDGGGTKLADRAGAANRVVAVDRPVRCARGGTWKSLDRCTASVFATPSSPDARARFSAHCNQRQRHG
ncbi:MAG: (NiFe) hydrogenase maturation protein HypF [Rhodospirillaceae bacterium]|nr:MAG: (NiFe) hydrogenase maturation protein HypF [Rhodospirillaceae bacterium]